jgi:hypothetical protein
VVGVSYIGEPFRHDLFVSYSHGTIDGAGLSPLKRWSDGFIEQLELELRQHPKLGRELALFFDDHHRPGHGLDPSSGLTQQLRDEIGASALLQVLMSDHYLLSAWCRDERDWWVAKQGELGLTLHDRVGVARIWPTSEPWPRPFVDERGHPFVGFCFYDKARADVRPQPYEWPAPDGASKGPFRDQLLELVGWLWQKIEALKQRADERRAASADAAKLAGDGGQALYLHAREEHTDTWEAARDALQRQGFAVFPTDQPPRVSRDPVAARKQQALRLETMSQCDALLLVGTDDGAAVDADLVVVGRGDRQLARARYQRYVPCGLVDTAGAPIATDARRRTARALQVDWIDGTRPPWPSDVQAWLAQKSVAAAGGR